MARDVHGRRLAGARDLPTDRQGLASRASGRLRGGLPLSQGRGLAAGAGGASRAARGAAERAGPPGPRGAGERRGTQAAPPAARRGTGRDRPRTRQDLGPWDRQPHARRAKIPRGDEPEDAGQGLRADRKSTRLNSSHTVISYAVFCLKKKKKPYKLKQVTR